MHENRAFFTKQVGVLIVFNDLVKSFELYLHPKELVKEKTKANFNEGSFFVAKYVAVLGLIIGLFAGFFASFIPFIGPFVGFGLILLLPLLLPLLVVLGLVIGTGLQYLPAKFLGGKGSFTQHFYLWALIYPASLIISLLQFIPAVGFLVMIALFFYNLYISFIIVKDLHKLSDLKTIFVLLFPLVLVLILGMIFAALVLIAYRTTSV